MTVIYLCAGDGYKKAQVTERNEHAVKMDELTVEALSLVSSAQARRMARLILSRGVPLKEPPR